MIVLFDDAPQFRRGGPVARDGSYPSSRRCNSGPRNKFGGGGVENRKVRRHAREIDVSGSQQCDIPSGPLTRKPVSARPTTDPLALRGTQLDGGVCRTMRPC